MLSKFAAARKACTGLRSGFPRQWRQGNEGVFGIVAHLGPAPLAGLAAPQREDGVVRSLPGFENATIARYGYAVEYDFVNPEQLEPSLQGRATVGVTALGRGRLAFHGPFARSFVTDHRGMRLGPICSTLPATTPYRVKG